MLCLSYSSKVGRVDCCRSCMVSSCLAKLIIEFVKFQEI